MKTLSTLFVLFAIAASIATTPSVFADHPNASVSAPAGTSVPGCEETDECFVPSEVTISVGGEVTWSNDDSAAHTVTSGSAADGPDGIFDSSLFMAGTTFSVTLEEAGTYPYFCMVHPWMVGTVIVEAEGAEEGMMEDKMMEGMMTEIQAMSSDGSITVEIETGDPVANDSMTIEVEFTDASGALVEHINYDISASQNGKSVLSDMGVHQHMGEGTHTTMALSSADPVDITVTLQGIGVDPPFTGPQGDVVEFHVVPEFGTIAMMILGVSIVSIIAFSARSKLVLPKL